MENSKNAISIPRRIMLSAALGIYLLILMKVIFFKHPWSLPDKGFYDIRSVVNLVPFRTISYYLTGLPQTDVAVRNLLGNLAIFVPFGFLLPILSPRYKTAGRLFGAAILFSLALETAQLLLRAGSFDVDDIILNSLGALLGLVAYRLIKLLQKPPKAES